MDRKKMRRNIHPLNINSLSGRILKLDNQVKSKNEFLMLYGIHATHERMYSFAEVFSDYGPVVMPDLPGMGGMDSFYKIGKKPTLDNYADYFASFIKMRYKRKKAILVCFSYSVPIVIRTLQKYPELIEKFEYIISIAGFVSHTDFKFSNMQKNFYAGASTLGKNYVVSTFLKNFIYKGVVIKSAYKLVSRTNPKISDLDKQALNDSLDFEVELWKKNDLRTWFYLIKSLSKIDLCNEKIRGIEIIHVSIKGDSFLNNYVVSQHMNVIFDKVKNIEADMTKHMPTILANKQEAKYFIPDEIIKKIKQNLVK